MFVRGQLVEHETDGVMQVRRCYPDIGGGFAVFCRVLGVRPRTGVCHPEGHLALHDDDDVVAPITSSEESEPSHEIEEECMAAGPCGGGDVSSEASPRDIPDGGAVDTDLTPPESPSKSVSPAGPQDFPDEVAARAIPFCRQCQARPAEGWCQWQFLSGHAMQCTVCARTLHRRWWYYCCSECRGSLMCNRCWKREEGEARSVELEELD